MPPSGRVSYKHSHQGNQAAHQMLLVKGVCHVERMRKDGKSLENLKIEDTRQEGRGGGNECSH